MSCEAVALGLRPHAFEAATLCLAGLTAEAHGAFWREALSSPAGLFTPAADSSGATVLPRRGANADALRRAGRMLCKSLLDDHPIGPGLCAYALVPLID